MMAGRLRVRDSTVDIDGRVLQVQEGGDPNGFPVFYHHGTPSARVLYEPWLEPAERAGIRMIGHDRPGYGGSSRHKGRRIADEVADVSAIADHLGVDTFATWGISGGGPHALACAALLPERVVACASLASVTPYDAEDHDFLAGMGEDNIVEFGAALEGEEALTPVLEQMRSGIHGATPDEMRDSLISLLTPADQAVCTGDTASFLTNGFNEGLRDGIDGWLDDDLAFVAPWGFDVADIKVPVLLWQGKQDLFVPFSHGEWLAGRIPGVEARLSDEDGHLTLAIQRVEETHDWLRAHA
jgi:pimeloyl-ACP methyl ester carboxylesterase